MRHKGIVCKPGAAPEKPDWLNQSYAAVNFYDLSSSLPKLSFHYEEGEINKVNKWTVTKKRKKEKKVQTFYVWSTDESSGILIEYTKIWNTKFGAFYY